MRRAMEAISSSSIGPGPLGILPTSPIASAPLRMAIEASANDIMQHIFIRVLMIKFKRKVEIGKLNTCVAANYLLSANLPLNAGNTSYHINYWRRTNWTCLRARGQEGRPGLYYFRKGLSC